MFDPTGSDNAAPSAGPTGRAAPSPAPSVVYDRPPPGLAQGRYPVPGWVLVVVGALVLAALLAFFGLRERRRRRDASASIPPSSRSPSSRSPSSRSPSSRSPSSRSPSSRPPRR
ncbi:MAG: hypothetical protein R3B72_21835 [Polyangiaceae bacterium]